MRSKYSNILAEYWERRVICERPGVYCMYIWRAILMETGVLYFAYMNHLKKSLSSSMAVIN